MILYGYDNNELSDFEGLNRGYRQVFLLKNGKFFCLNIYDVVRLQQDFETELEAEGFFGIESNIILVQNVTPEDMKFTIEKLDRQGYFEKLKPVEGFDSKDLKVMFQIG